MEIGRCIEQTQAVAGAQTYIGKWYKLRVLPQYALNSDLSISQRARASATLSPVAALSWDSTKQAANSRGLGLASSVARSGSSRGAISHKYKRATAPPAAGKDKVKHAELDNAKVFGDTDH